MQQLAGNWQGWTIDKDCIYSPNGDRFTPECLLACFFYRQIPDVWKHWRQLEPETHLH